MTDDLMEAALQVWTVKAGLMVQVIYTWTARDADGRLYVVSGVIA